MSSASPRDYGVVQRYRHARWRVAVVDDVGAVFVADDEEVRAGPAVEPVVPRPVRSVRRDPHAGRNPDRRAGLRRPSRFG